MIDFILFTIFVFIMAFLQKMSSAEIAGYNANIGLEQHRKKDKGTFMVITMLVMMVLAMFRGINVGSDTEAYHQIFNQIITNPEYSHSSRYEVGYVLLNQLVGKITTDPQGVIMVTSFFYYIVFIWFIKKYSQDYSFVLVLFYLMVFSETINIIRQQIATAFILIAIDRILNKQTIRSLVWIIIATLFHDSAIVFLILPIMPHIKYYNAVAIAGLLVVAVLTFGNLLPKLVGLIAPQYEHYFYGSNAGTGEVTVFYEVMRGIVFLGIATHVVRLKKTYDKPILECKLGYQKQRNMILWVLCFVLVVTLMSFNLYVFRRFAIYMGILNIVFLSNYMRKITNDWGKIIKFAIIVVLLTYYALIQYTRPTWNTAFPYEVFF